MLVNRIPLKHNGKIVGVILQTVLRDYKDFTDLARKLNMLERKVKRQEMALERIFSPKYTFDSIIGESKTISKTFGPEVCPGRFTHLDSWPNRHRQRVIRSCHAGRE